MNNLVLAVSAVLLIFAVRYHAKAQINIKEKKESVWYERLFTGSRAATDNLTDEGLKFRKQSNLYAIAGLIVLALYVWLRSTT